MRSASEKRGTELPRKELALLASTLTAVIKDELSVPPELREHVGAIFRETGRTIQEILVEAEEKLGEYSLVKLLEMIDAVIDPETLSITVEGKAAAEILRKYFGEDTDFFVRKLAEEYLVRKYGSANNPFKEMERDGVLTPVTARIITKKTNPPLKTLIDVWQMLDKETRRNVLMKKTAYELYVLLCGKQENQEYWRVLCQ